MSITKHIALTILLSATATACSFQSDPNVSNGSQKQVGDPSCAVLPQPAPGANPAAAYCEALGYENSGEQCLFEDGTSCEQWSFYLGQCGQPHSFCNLHGGTVSSVTEDQGGWTAEYALCTLADGRQCKEDTFAHTCQCEEKNACEALPAPAPGANPAAAYCDALGYEAAGEQCVFEDGTSCEQWSFFRGRCGQAHSFCNLHGGTVSSATEDQGGRTAEYAVCTLADGRQCKEDTFAHTCQCE